MFWLLILVGIVLVFVGTWGGPAVSQRAAEEAKPKGPRSKPDAWEILAEPLAQEEELIKIPEPRPWYLPGQDRRFRQGLLVGLGTGLMVAGVVTLFVPRQPAAQTPVAAGQQPGAVAGGNQTGTAAPPQQGQGGTTPDAPDEEPAQQGGEAPKPANVTFTIEVGDLPSTVAANLKAAGLIADEAEFLARIAEQGLDTSLKAGTFVIPSEATLDAVIDALT